MKVRTSLNESGVALVEVKGEMTAYTAPNLDKALNGLLDQGHGRLLIDGRELGFISSAGLRVLLAAHREATTLGGEVRLFGLKEHVHEVFKMAGFERLMRIRDDRAGAMEGW